MLDQDSHGPTTSDALKDANQLVTLDVVSAAFEAAGLPRSLRTLQRYCSNGTLDCVKEATDTGDTYFVRSASIVPAITALRQLHEAKDRHRQTAPGPVMSNTVAGGIANHTVDDDDRPGPTATDTIVETLPKPPMATEPDTTGLVAQLESRIGEKDAEIAFLREELTDRRGQIRDMKGIIDGQNQLLETLNRNVAPVFQALATAVEKGRIGAPRPIDATNSERETESGQRLPSE